MSIRQSGVKKKCVPRGTSITHLLSSIHTCKHYRQRGRSALVTPSPSFKIQEPSQNKNKHSLGKTFFLFPFLSGEEEVPPKRGNVFWPMLRFFSVCCPVSLPPPWLRAQCYNIRPRPRQGMTVFERPFLLLLVFKGT